MAAIILGAQQTATEPKKGQSSFLSDAPRWFIVVLGIAYATGFVVVSTFLDSFGVQNATSDLLRLKYLQVGFFFLLFLGSVIILTVCMKKGLELQRQAIADNQTDTSDTTVKDNARTYLSKMYPQRILIWINVLVAIYLAVGFAPPHSASRVLPPVTVLLVVAVAGSIGITALGSKYATGNKDLPRLIWVLRWILLLTLALIDGFIIWPFGSRLKPMFVHDWKTLVVFSALLIALWYMAYRGAFRPPDRSEEEHRLYMWPLVTLWLAIYYLSVLAFAHGIYPYMTAARGGGYFPDSAQVRLILKQTQGGCPETFVVNGSTCRSDNMILIEENSSAAFIADPNEPKLENSRGGFHCWTDSFCRPKVFEVKLTEILYIEHLPRENTE